MTVLHESNSRGNDCHARFILTDGMMIKFIAGEGDLISGPNPPKTTFINKRLQFSNAESLQDFLVRVRDSTTTDPQSRENFLALMPQNEFAADEPPEVIRSKLLLAHHRIKEAAEGMLDYLSSSGLLD